MEALRYDASVNNFSIKAALRTDPGLQLPFLCSVVNSIISTVAGIVAIVGLVESCTDSSPSDKRNRLSQWEQPCPTPWDPDEIVSVRRLPLGEVILLGWVHEPLLLDSEPTGYIKDVFRHKSVLYVVAINLPLWESRSRMLLRDSWHQDVARYMESELRSWYVSSSPADIADAPRSLGRMCISSKGLSKFRFILCLRHVYLYDCVVSHGSLPIRVPDLVVCWYVGVPDVVSDMAPHGANSSLTAQTSLRRKRNTVRRT